MRWQLLDKFIECDPGKRAVGVKCFTRSEIFFMDHFPGFPIVPGVLQIEMLAQTGGKCLRLEKEDQLPVLGMVKSAKFIRNIEPGDRAVIHAEIIKRRDAYAVMQGHIEVDGQKVSEAEIMFAMVPSAKMTAGHEDGVMSHWKAKQKAAAATVKAAEGVTP